MPTRTPPVTKPTTLIDPKVPAILIVLEDGEVTDVVLRNTTGHVFVADKDKLALLTGEEKKNHLLLGFGSRVAGTSAIFEEELASILNGAPDVPVVASEDHPASVQSTPADETVASPVEPQAEATTEAGVTSTADAEVIPAPTSTPAA
jgi:hypothetical protein